MGYQESYVKTNNINRLMDKINELGEDYYNELLDIPYIFEFTNDHTPFKKGEKALYIVGDRTLQRSEARFLGYYNPFADNTELQNKYENNPQNVADRILIDNTRIIYTENINPIGIFEDSGMVTDIIKKPFIFNNKENKILKITDTELKDNISDKTIINSVKEDEKKLNINITDKGYNIKEGNYFCYGKLNNLYFYSEKNINSNETKTIFNDTDFFDYSFKKSLNESYTIKCNNNKISNNFFNGIKNNYCENYLNEKNLKIRNFLKNEGNLKLSLYETKDLYENIEGNTLILDTGKEKKEIMSEIDIIFEGNKCLLNSYIDSDEEKKIQSFNSYELIELAYELNEQEINHIIKDENQNIETSEQKEYLDKTIEYRENFSSFLRSCKQKIINHYDDEKQNHNINVPHVNYKVGYSPEEYQDITGHKINIENETTFWDGLSEFKYYIFENNDDAKNFYNKIFNETKELKSITLTLEKPNVKFNLSTNSIEILSQNTDKDFTLHNIQKKYEKNVEKTLSNNPKTSANILNKKITENLTSQQIEQIFEQAEKNAKNTNIQNKNNLEQEHIENKRDKIYGTR